MNARKISSNGTLQKVLRLLQCGPATTMRIISLCGVCAVNSIISELRANGIAIDCKQIERGVYEYSLHDALNKKGVA